MADEAEKIDTARDERRCGTCRGFRPESGECRMGLPATDSRFTFDQGRDGWALAQITFWPKPPDGADDPGCEFWAEAVLR